MSGEQAAREWLDKWGATYHGRTVAMLNAYAESECSRLASRVKELEQVLIAIARALKEPAGGEFWCARKLADKVGIYLQRRLGRDARVTQVSRICAGRGRRGEGIDEKVTVLAAGT